MDRMVLKGRSSTHIGTICSLSPCLSDYCGYVNIAPTSPTPVASPRPPCPRQEPWAGVPRCKTLGLRPPGVPPAVLPLSPLARQGATLLPLNSIIPVIH
ncbi:hypothetical protein J6590_034056 [Homalodisca vitripennis]|nr:hypothetical protein J6590_034056 [Homalodisca vitripennis]